MFEKLKKIEGIRPLRYVGDKLIGKFVSYGSFYERDWFTDEDVYFIVPQTSGSDYSGCTVTWANNLYFENEYRDNDWIHFAYGGYSTYAVVINATKLYDSEITEEILEILEDLEDYPLIDGEMLINVEMELIEDEWECWGKDDFVRELEAKFSFADFDFPDLRDLFEEKKEEDWECEGYGPNMYIDVKAVIKEIEFVDVEKWAIKYTVTWNNAGECKLYYYELEIAERKVIDLKSRGFHATIS